LDDNTEFGWLGFEGDAIMKYTKDKLYELLPSVYRQEDAKLGKPLEALISIIAEQVDVLEQDIEQLFENWFIETCDEWVAPYIGDLVGASLLATSYSSSSSSSFLSSSVEKKKIASKKDTAISQRAWVANTISYRRRKGTVFVLEQLARDVTGWNAKAVEFFQLLGTTQYLNHLRLSNFHTPDLRMTEMLELINTPFDITAHTVDVRSIKKRRGCYNIQNIGIFLWRLGAYPVYNAPALPYGDGRFGFNQVGLDIPLFNPPAPERTITHLAEEINVPTTIRRLALKQRLTDYYGAGKSILIIVNGSPVGANDIIVCNLQDWKHRPPTGKIALDPILGRIAFPVGNNPANVHVNYYYGFSADIGGGFFDREEPDESSAIGGGHGAANLAGANAMIIKISKDATTIPDAVSKISDALDKWTAEGKPSAILRILDSEFYEESLEISIPENVTLVIQSANEKRPVLKADLNANPNGGVIKVATEGGGAGMGGGVNSKLVFDGLLIDKSLRITIDQGDLGSLIINQCTLAPQDAPSVQVSTQNNSLQLQIIKSITGKILTSGSEAKLSVKDSIVDGVAKDGNEEEEENGTHSPQQQNHHIAIDCYKADIESTTVFGRVSVTLLNSSNTIFTEKITAKRRQQGCVRFSYIPLGSEVPRRYRCQPSDNETDLGLKPYFTSERYGDPGYAQLHKDISSKIFEGAEDESEMGAFHSLYQPQRIKNLESSLEEYLRFGLEAGLLMVDVVVPSSSQRDSE
jgi:hypothetical protein